MFNFIFNFDLEYPAFKFGVIFRALSEGEESNTYEEVFLKVYSIHYTLG